MSSDLLSSFFFRFLKNMAVPYLFYPFSAEMSTIMHSSI
ncbi:hypothetical protein FH5_03316 [Priestia endophytica]|nr:hypothetical protein FH5_03316 [Priestia endophytica]